MDYIIQEIIQEMLIYIKQHLFILFQLGNLASFFKLTSVFFSKSNFSIF